MSFNEMYDFLREVVGVSEESLRLIFGINGQNEKTACDVLFFYTGWRSFEGLREEMEEA